MTAVTHEEIREEGFGRELTTLAAVVVLGTIMTVLDLTIVNVAIPTLQRELDTSIATVQWVLTAYTLAFASVIPLTGWATERFGARRVWIGSLVVFLAGSALAGAAWSIGSLIAFRALQGFGAGMILPVGQTILAQAAGPQRMGRVMSVIGVPMLLAPVFGPVLGGAIVDGWSWRWIFYLNLPVGIAAVAAAARWLPATVAHGRRLLDVRGLLLLTPGIAVSLYGLAEAGNRGGFGETRVVAAVATGLALVVLFVIHAAARGEDALLDIALFRRRGFAAASAANLVLAVALFGSLILLPLYYQIVRHESPLEVGLLLVPQGVGAALAMPLAGLLTDRLGARVVVPAGLAAAIAGMLFYTQVGAETSYVALAAALFVVGLGIGSTIMPSMAAAFATLSREETPRATSALNAIQRTGGAIGTALLAVVLQRSLRGAHDADALADGFATAFWVAVALLAAALVPALLLPRAER
jgi:EmrB/QacA subfamily drug resistance transporter